MMICFHLFVSYAEQISSCRLSLQQSTLSPTHSLSAHSEVPTCNKTGTLSKALEKFWQDALADTISDSYRSQQKSNADCSIEFTALTTKPWLSINPNKRHRPKISWHRSLTHHFNDLYFGRQPQVVDERLNVAFHLNAVVLHHCVDKQFCIILPVNCTFLHTFKIYRKRFVYTNRTLIKLCR